MPRLLLQSAVLLGLLVPAATAQTAPLPIDAMIRAMEGLQLRSERNEDRLIQLLTWIYEIKPQVTNDQILFQALVGYQSRLEALQAGGYIDGESTMREVEIGVRRAISDAQVRAAGGAPVTTGAPPSATPTGRQRTEQDWADEHRGILNASVVLYETFESATAGWPSTPESGELVAFRAGRYTLGVTDESWHYFTIPVRALANATTYAIDAPIRRTRNEGGENAAFGLIWGLANNQNYCAFLIYPDLQAFTVDCVASGLSTSLVAPAQMGPGISGESGYRLAVTRSGDQMAFWINGLLVARAPSVPITGTEVGYWVGPGQTISADSFALGVR